MPTGGVDCTEDSIDKWFDAGVSAVGLGSKLFVKIDGKYQYGAISENCDNLLNWARRKTKGY
jgi:2-dehydro-3-deoxyphosphogluconate aldolase/(4S)-4-hydroxy-2-oxoglutarate aldolase